MEMTKTNNKGKKYTNKNKSNMTYNEDIRKLLIIIGVILIVFVIIYFFIGIFITKEIDLFNNNESEQKASSIQYEEILAGETFNMNQDEYYVIFSGSKGNYYSIYKNIITNQVDKKIYIVDISNPLNNAYVSEESNSNVQKASDLKIKDNTLIKINQKQNVEYIEGKDQILSYFK